MGPLATNHRRHCNDYSARCLSQAFLPPSIPPKTPRHDRGAAAYVYVHVFQDPGSSRRQRKPMAKAGSPPHLRFPDLLSVPNLSLSFRSLLLSSSFQLPQGSQFQTPNPKLEAFFPSFDLPPPVLVSRQCLQRPGARFPIEADKHTIVTPQHQTDTTIPKLQTK